MGLAENDVGAAVPGQVGDGDIASLVAVEGRAADLVKSILASPVDPGTFSPIVEIAAGKNQVVVSVPVYVANGHGQSLGAKQFQGSAWASILAHRQKGDALRPGQEEVWEAAQMDDAGQRLCFLNVLGVLDRAV
ncbi:MAG: hypothetical protein OXN87_01390 [Chloroflexota bacterium]|nr:hypothetical protein [Chloroflexota bacterium]